MIRRLLEHANDVAATLGRHVPLVLLTHPFELILGMALIVNGLAGMAGYPSPSLTQVPFWPLHLYLVVSTTGGALLVWALCRRDEANPLQGSGRALERAALFLVAAGYHGLSAVILLNNSPRGVPSAIVFFLVGVACLLRAWAIRRATLVILQQLERSRA